MHTRVWRAVTARRVRGLALAACLLAPALASAQAPAGLPPVIDREIFFGDPEISGAQISPDGQYIAFTKQNAGRFHIGVMRTDGSEERLLTASFLDEGPTWAPNGRVIMFMRESAGESGQSALFSVDISGRNLRQISTDGPASDPAWSPKLN